jgi:hypothetical protein
MRNAARLYKSERNGLLAKRSFHSRGVRWRTNDTGCWPTRYRESEEIIAISIEVILAIQFVHSKRKNFPFPFDLTARISRRIN